MNFLIDLLVGSVWCFGVYKIFDDILGFIAVRVESKIGHYWCKPLFYCPACMGSVHGVLLSLLFLPMTWPIIILYCVCLCGLNYIINQLLPE